MEDRLIIKDFGPIKDLDIELKDVMVFIGPQGTGKSTIAKVISGIRDDENGFVGQRGIIELLNGYHLELDLKNDFLVKYRYRGAKVEFSKKESRVTILSYQPCQTRYIPAERGFLPHLLDASLAFQEADLPIPRTLLKFGSLFQKARFNIPELKINGTGLTYRFENGQDRVFHDSNESVRLSNSASGVQALLPMMLVIEHLIRKNQPKGNSFVIEEPELNLYPKTQKALTENLVEKCTQGNNKLILTTHSPYILTSLDNLILADNVVREKPELREEVAKIVPESQWLDFDRVGVWYVNNGTATSIMDPDLRAIGAHKIDDVSEDIAEVFDRLTQLRYQEESV